MAMLYEGNGLSCRLVEHRESVLLRIEHAGEVLDAKPDDIVALSGITLTAREYVQLLVDDGIAGESDRDLAARFS